MKLKNLIKVIENKYPINLAYEWDNVGLLIGDFESNIKKVLVTLEANEKIIEEAIQNEIDLIITHHPFLFNKINKVNTGDFKGRLIHKLIKNDIALYSMHTNFDIAFDGLNDYFMELMGFESEGIIETTNIYKFENKEAQVGLGRVSKLREPKTLLEVSKLIKEKLKMKHIRVVGELDTVIKKVAVVTGSGADMVKKAQRLKAQVIITGDVKYHDAQDALDMGMTIIDCGHFETEDIFKDIMYKFLSCNEEIEVIKSNINLNPFNII